MVLQEQHEGSRRQMTTRHAARLAQVARMFSLIDEAFRETACQLPGRLLSIVEVVAAVFASQERVQDIVPIVVPLRIDILAEM